MDIVRCGPWESSKHRIMFCKAPCVEIRKKINGSMQVPDVSVGTKGLSQHSLIGPNYFWMQPKGLCQKYRNFKLACSCPIYCQLRSQQTQTINELVMMGLPCTTVMPIPAAWLAVMLIFRMLSTSSYFNVLNLQQRTPASSGWVQGRCPSSCPFYRAVHDLEDTGKQHCLLPVCNRHISHKAHCKLKEVSKAQQDFKATKSP